VISLISTVNTFRRMRWASHVAGIGEKKIRTIFWWGDLNKKRMLRRDLTEI